MQRLSHLMQLSPVHEGVELGPQQAGDLHDLEDSGTG